MNLPWVASCPKHRVFILQPENWARALRYLSLIAAVSATCQAVRAAPLSSTVTALTVTSGAGAVTTVPAGNVVALTATVNAGSAAVTIGQVNFCDASASNCTDIHLLGTSQLTAAGTAILRFRPGIGNHSYKAVFAGTNNDAGSSSSVSALAVTGTASTLATTTTIAETGSSGNYGLTATVTESGGTLPPTGTVSFLDTSNGNAVLAAPTLGAAVAGFDWPNPQRITTNNITQAVALGDFNGDGIPDVATTGGTYAQPLVILLGNSDGSYTTAAALSLPTFFLGSIAVADFNGDGKQDLALLDAAANAVIILLGNGDGTFQMAASSPAVAQDSNQVVVGDFNGDGNQDLVVSAVTSTVLLGNGDGTFNAVPAPNSPFGGTPYAIALGDFNRDGNLDLAVSYPDNHVLSIMLGNGDGTFALPNHVAAFQTPGTAIGVADFNGDGKLDLALGVNDASTVGGVGDSVTILAGNGDGTFSYAPSGPLESLAAITSINVGDFNGDGVPDLAVTDEFGTLIVYVANGSGSFAAYTPPTLVSGFGLALVCAVGDLNGDGRSDLALGGYTNLISLYTTEPTETAAATANISLPGAGPHLVEGSYSGDSNYHSSLSGTLSLVGVPVATTTTTLSASATSVDEQQKVTLTATVQGNSPAGAVTFLNGAINLGTAPISGNSASLTTSFANAGSVSLTASYTGDANNLASTSSPITVTIVAPSFALAVSPASATVTPGQSATFTVTVTPADGFATAVTLGCGALPSQASCAFATPSVTPGGGQPVQVMLTVSTAASTADLRQKPLGLPGREPWFPAGAVVSLAGLLGLARVRRASLRWRQLLQAVALLTTAWALSASFIGCGGGGGGTTPNNPGTPAGTSTISISATATGSSSPQTASIKLIVE
jgi:Bacterial Ig-like domain (group 3)/FG-GAP-like repeat